MKNLKNWLPLICFSMLAQPVFAADFVIIIHPSVGVSSISRTELKQILLANQTTWKDGKKVAIITLSPDATGADDVAQEYMSMTAIQAKKYWLTKVFNGVLPGQPATGDSADEVAEKVASTVGALSILPKGSKTGKAKTLTETP